MVNLDLDGWFEGSGRGIIHCEATLSAKEIRVERSCSEGINVDAAQYSNGDTVGINQASAVETFGVWLRFITVGSEYN